MKNNKPLADSIRPTTINEVAGQKHLLSEDSSKRAIYSE